MNKWQVVKSGNESLDSESFLSLYESCPIPSDEKLSHLGLFTRRQPMSRVMFMWEVYKKIIDVHGVIFEFGVRWGQDLALFESFRGMLEPFNYNRKIVGFDTFSVALKETLGLNNIRIQRLPFMPTASFIIFE